MSFLNDSDYRPFTCELCGLGMLGYEADVHNCDHKLPVPHEQSNRSTGPMTQLVTAEGDKGALIHCKGVEEVAVPTATGDDGGAGSFTIKEEGKMKGFIDSIIAMVKNERKSTTYHRAALRQVEDRLAELRLYADRLENTVEIQRIKIEKLESGRGR